LLAQNRTGINIALLPPPTEKRRSLCPSANLLEASSSATGPAGPPRRSTALLRPSPDGDAAGFSPPTPLPPASSALLLLMCTEKGQFCLGPQAQRRSRPGEADFFGSFKLLLLHRAQNMALLGAASSGPSSKNSFRSRSRIGTKQTLKFI